ncbi:MULTISPECIES: phosphohistidine phosphatase SixA [unclassified Shewanella]|uniref:phosphohistidine phosphatase SixA n=1 Tax=unclassified Shewanella TaxID=196818 RepID=UPI000C828863|nr:MULTISPECIES: phosphohistidine phosphatase SixA [unclassified Shewanella]MDO6617726.1 phosphohistidine phosphatase SixA [Shewanella sp. 6_MG-2023]MDO6639107.1 phosphohistidine phosphatase SixA [Shewanella sp. 5_MG-2023]MDO6677641.1 phosphohistidine phosphatase SixA [Shewanella sp. 4_MG-2023]MDO6777481.1 phosphohistidine phosphatase SixA [Shewanella sp. 3_MG-2023]PMG28034.1 phosphohistidine phosphatase SixA [Shewanella sp. 10N.286.52.C2]
MQLFLMRHGEASFDAPSDRERMLSQVGRNQSNTMANWLTQKVNSVDLVIVSPYLRAQQTWQEVAKHLPEPNKWLVLDDITPSGSPQIAVDAILAYAEHYNAQKVLVIAHMPILGYMVSELVAGMEPPIFATSAIVSIDKNEHGFHFELMQTPTQISA